MLRAGNDPITSLFAGDMGLKRIYVGDEIVHERPGGVIYIELVAGGADMVQFAPLGATALLDSSGKSFLCKSE